MLNDILQLLTHRWDFFLRLFGEHLMISGIAASLAIVIGVSLGVLISEHKKLTPFVIQTSNIIYTIPSISLFGLLILVSGVGNLSAIIATSAYDFHFKGTRDLDISLKYQALLNRQIDVVSVSTTDGALANPAIKLLIDDKHFYTDYYAGTVVREESLKKYPQLHTVLLKMDGLISEQEMAKLNDLVENQGQDEKTVAKAFLKEKGLLK